ncbi:stabilin-1 [Varanus komodoensis]|uniref:stabilin-1 n=1 Tax=Varanus komodoensis TaxID=61221 RepID=UPI001CF788B2|nr:stabilin-1 [Varanus komodoensis]
MKIPGLLFLFLATFWVSPGEGQSQQLRSMRCNRKSTFTQNTPCTSCAIAPRLSCPTGMVRMAQGAGRCRYTVKLSGETLSLQGCTYLCKKDMEEEQCCPGFWGSECYECPGGRGNVCGGHGVCLDGVTQNGTCICMENYGGYACQDCQDKNHFGPDCQSVCECQHGICNHGPSGDGSCTCYAGYTGPKCDQELSSCGGVICQANSLCVTKDGQPRCECMPGYRKHGSYCQAQDPCSSSPCSVFATCKAVAPIDYECTCKEGYHGNGRICQPINPCLTDNGGCPKNSTICAFERAGESTCLCKTGMSRSSRQWGNRMGCSPINFRRCFHFSCDSSSICEEDPSGTVKCVCQDGKIGDGRLCYSSIMQEILSLNRKLFGRTGYRLFELGCELMLNKYGPFTVFLPLVSYSRETGSDSSLEENLCKTHIILGQHLWSDLVKTRILRTLSGHTVTFTSQYYQFSDAPQQYYMLRQGNLPAANGIIHTVSLMRKQPALDNLGNVQKTIAEILASAEVASRFETILENCDMPSILDNPGPFTVFVPSNEAVDKLRDGRLIYLFTQGINKLQELVKHHIYPRGAVKAEKLVTMPHILTMANQMLTVRISEDGKLQLGDAAVALSTMDIVASNGVIHLLDGIFIPPSIVPILPNRCSELHYRIKEGSCVDCGALNTSICPPDSKPVEDGSFPEDCTYIHDSLGLHTIKKGCRRSCNQTVTTPGCCKGFFGPNCIPCPGGFSNACYGRGECSGGIKGNGQCHCFPGFKGIACHICSDPNKHGKNCDEDCGCIHGICDNRPGSRGVCQPRTCKAGYSGEFCDKSSHNCGPPDASLYCHVNAVCSINTTARCICLDGYEGDGFSCKPIDICSEPEWAGCSENAVCTRTGPGTATCQCNKGWTGDGKACVAIDNCAAETRGGCHANADCNYIGPGQSSCVCKQGYDGDGYSCDPIDPCLTDNGGCHELAVCQTRGPGEKVCQCPEGYMGDGTLCYGDVIKELARNYHFLTFYEWVKKSLFSFPQKANVTVLVPLKTAIQNLSDAEKDFWLEPDMLLTLVRAHILQGSFMTEQLKAYVGQELSTLNPQTRWRISNSSGVVTIQNASIVVGDIPAINSTIYIIDKVLLPASGNVPPTLPGLQQQLNATPSFSQFKDLLEQYELIGDIESAKKYTIFVPRNSSVEKYCKASNITQLDKDTVLYHVVPGDKFFPEDLKNGVHRSTMLGFSYWLMFYKDTNQTYVNKVLLEGPVVETRNGMLIGVSQVLQIQKNRCTANITTVEKGRCMKCGRKLRCPKGSVLEKTPEKGSSRHCTYRSGKQRLVGCYLTCVKVSLVSLCCPGYYGHMCEMCPGKPGSWCSGNGECQDGTDGSGECRCREGFHGTACEMCQPGRYSTNCSLECNCQNKAICSDGLLGNGSCECAAGFEGPFCEQEIKKDLCNGTCHEKANCINDTTTSQPTCLCSAGYTGNGSHCSETDLCTVANGGCSKHAYCAKAGAGRRTCTCKEGYAGDGTLCREIDRCLENNGGCHQYAECVKTGPGLVACNCLPKYTGNGKDCTPINPCMENNGGCSPLAICLKSAPGNRTCLCLWGTGDGFTCLRTVWQEFIANEAAVPFFHYIENHGITEMMGMGTYTLFIPYVNHLRDSTTFSEWQGEGFIADLLRYHVVICQALQLDDLDSQDSITALSGHKIRVSVKEDTVYLNDEAKIIRSIPASNGVVHFIDKILIPYDLKHHGIPSSLSVQNITEVAEAYGYKIYSRLLKEAGLLSVVNNTLHQPFTMLWPTDAAFNSLPLDMQKWLYHKDHRSKLAAYLKGHIIREKKLLASQLTETKALRTFHGSTISFSCGKTSAGDILVDNGNAQIVQRYMKFDVGIAYGIDHLLEPSDLGSRCDEFRSVESSDSLCGLCGSEPHCPPGTTELGESQSCTPSTGSYFNSGWSYHRRKPYWWQTSSRANRMRLRTKTSLRYCKRTCFETKWIPQCCANHYGKDCLVCPGGLEAPCSNHGTCDDGHPGSGRCNCSAAYIGTACEHCSPGRYGPDCKECNCSENGICNEGLLGDGFCFCAAGWTGENCEVELAALPQCSPACHRNAVCRANNTCECNLNYEGDGRTCTVIDLCGNDNGGCSYHANCTQVGTDVFCSCFPDYEGDGSVCLPIDRCADGRNGDCSEHATCIYTGPNSRRCECKVGYVGNGIQCLEEAVPPTDRCLEDNGQCHPDAVCTDLHFHDKTAGVFHLQSPGGKYSFTYQEAEAGCAAEGATMATLQQLSAAQQMGLHLCIVGWLYNRSAGYPTVYPSKKCGAHHVGIVDYGYRMNASEKWDAYCYRAQDVQCYCGDGFLGDGYMCVGSVLAVLAQHANLSVYYSMILDYANATQEGLDFFNFLSRDTSYKTLFAPLNSGFGDNTSLTLNNLKLHVSVSDVLLLSTNLTAGTIIPSQAGYNLSIADSVNSSRLPDSKMINNTLIVELDILASNGIIHAIESPLMAPLHHGQFDQIVHPVTSPAVATISAGAVVATLLLLAAVAGGSYCYLKRNNQRFQFRYFKAELEEEESSPWEERSPHSVSIPNPIYGADTSLYEPFEDPLCEEDFSDTHGILGH